MTLVVEQDLGLEEISVRGYEKVIRVSSPAVGLQGIISLHSLTMGPALGGIRIYPYATFDLALEDALRLSKGMTYKSAVSECGWGGGKSVIIADPKTHKTPALLRTFGQAINRLKGEYIGAEDVGCTPADMLIMSEATPYVVGLPAQGSSGNPSPYTAWGTYRGIQAVLSRLFGSDSPEGKTVAIQGLGSVGMELAKLLFWSGAKLIVSDIDMVKCRNLAVGIGAQVASVHEVLFAECDVLAPCAMGGIINRETISQLRCKAIAGCANNQLLVDADADLLAARNILYAPDFVINAGGLINVSQELAPEGYQPGAARNRVNAIYDQLVAIFDISKQNRCSTHQAAVSLGDYRLKYGIGKRTEPPCFHHAQNGVGR
jgi:leucine dehydrogenase